jgi:hypothetical protein
LKTGIAVEHVQLTPATAVGVPPLLASVGVVSGNAFEIRLTGPDGQPARDVSGVKVFWTCWGKPPQR